MNKKLKTLLIAMLLIPCITVFVACGGNSSAGIKSLQEYKEYVDGYLATLDSGVTQAAFKVSTALVATASEIYNFKFEIEQILDGELDVTATVRVDSDKVMFIHNYHTGSHPYTTYTYFDGKSVYEKRVEMDGSPIHDWQLTDDTYHTATLFISAFQQILDPDMYNKIEEKDKHIYTLKEGKLFPDMSEGDTAKITITEDSLFLEQVVGNSESSRYGTCKITIGGQTVTQPSGLPIK